MAPFHRQLPLAAVIIAMLAAAPVHSAAPGANPAPAAPPAAPEPPGMSRTELKAIINDAQATARRAGETARIEVDRAMRDFDASRIELALAEGIPFLPPSLAFVASEFGDSREIVKNAPYQAEAVIETTQTLQDGNRIVKKSTTLLARDTYGRTRQERKGDSGATIYLFDPIAARNYIISTDAKTAVRVPRVPSAPVPPAAPPSPLAMQEPAAPTPPVAPAPPTPLTSPTSPLPPLPATPPTIKRESARGSVEVSPERIVIRKNGDVQMGKSVDVGPNGIVVRKQGDGMTPGEEVRIEVIRVGRGEGAGLTGPLLPSPPLPPLTLPVMPRDKGETKSLGTREFDGVKAEGTLTTNTIPAGAIGNERPIVIGNERWFSPELQLVVAAKTTDPRAGETSYRLVNLKRGEPPAELFRVPADYTTRGTR